MKTKDDQFNLMSSISKSLVSKLFISSPDTYHKECYCKTKFLQSQVLRSGACDLTSLYAAQHTCRISNKFMSGR